MINERKYRIEKFDLVREGEAFQVNCESGSMRRVMFVMQCKNSYSIPDCSDFLAWLRDNHLTPSSAPKKDTSPLPDDALVPQSTFGLIKLDPCYLIFLSYFLIAFIFSVVF